MKDCPFKQYCNDDCETCTDEDKAHKIQNVANALQPIVGNIVEVLTPVIKETAKTINRLWYTIVQCYPNKRVVHLALHHPKARVRKKNITRIMRWINTSQTERGE